MKIEFVCLIRGSSGDHLGIEHRSFLIEKLISYDVLHVFFDFVIDFLDFWWWGGKHGKKTGKKYVAKTVENRGKP